ncbi:MAG TPA: CBS domain-containing protein, partial [Bryobacteraceae bacterium]|nr:CBS domain-containing protein [Bryobacteraceae bacterium]
MTLALVLLLACLSVLLTGVTFVQVLYLESLRLRTRGLAALTFFKEEIQDRIGLRSERGALAFSLIKHTLIVLAGVLAFGVTSGRNDSPWAALLEACLVAWLILLGAAYVVPQVLYRKTQGRWVLPFVPLLRALSLMVAPLAAVLRFFQTVVDLGDQEPASDEEPKAEEHIEALISAGTEEGIIQEEDRALIQAAVEFGDKTVREVMTPRPRIVAIEVARSLEHLRDLAINEQYSRIPVYEKTIDHIVGFIHVRDLFELDEEERRQKSIRDLMRPVRVVPETQPVSDLVKEMQSDRAHMVIVVDEYGNTAGLATL